MSSRHSPYPVVDIFAGPGGLGEGFSSISEKGSPAFESIVSIERDEDAHRTLLLRHFVRAFHPREVPEEYYSFLRGRLSLEELFAKFPKQHASAKSSALKISLGSEAHNFVKTLIAKRLSGRRRWALVGGPPCQAYSLVGRSRMKGDPDFENDERHFLYKEYLKILADHQPPVFVMENVKGLLSATVGGERVIDKILADLSDPVKALRGRSGGATYKLYSLSEHDKPLIGVDPKIFLVKAELYGVPQARHRMFIVGIRSDVRVRPKQLKQHRPPSTEQTIGNLPKIRSRISKTVDDRDHWMAAVRSISDLNLTPAYNGYEYAARLAKGIEVYSGSDANWPTRYVETRYPGPARARHDVLGWIHDPRLDVLTSHESRSHMPADLKRYFYAAVFAEVLGRSPRLADFPKALLPKHQNVELGRTGKMFSDRFRVQLPKEVSATVTSHISKDGHYFIHYDPNQCRSLTVREAARLQTFPDNYCFLGSRTSQYHQVGNAVPPYLARQIADVIVEVLDRMGGAP